MTADTFDSDVLASDKPVLVEFWAAWCGPCRLLAPRLADIAEQHADKITVVTVDVDADPEIAADHNILSIPTMTLFVDGVATMSLSGAKSKVTILDSLAAWL